MLGDTLSHVFSLLQALSGAAPARASEIELAARPGAVTLRFTYRCGAAAVPCDVTLRSGDQLPREAAYAVNGRWAERRIQPADYSFCFAAGAREVAAPDPLVALLRETLAVFAGPGAPAPDPASPARRARLEQILEALPASGG
jgi:hypothetical protein